MDTSGLTSGATITAATFYRYGNGAGNATETTYPASVALVESTISGTSVATSDWPNVGNTRFCDTDITIQTAAGGAYRSWVLNATGLAAINKTGFTKLALKAANDFSDSTAPTARSFSREWEYSEGSNDPYLEVTYTVGGTFRPRVTVY
jgi:hypothetical protein